MQPNLYMQRMNSAQICRRHYYAKNESQSIVRSICGQTFKTKLHFHRVVLSSISDSTATIIYANQD